MLGAAGASIGIRASGVGIGGAGVYVCPTPLHILGWEQYGGDTWRQKVGRALWAENWKNVLLSGCDADKIELVLVMKCAKSMVSQYTRERPHAAVLKRRLLVKDGGHGWFPKAEIVKVRPGAKLRCVHRLRRLMRTRAASWTRRRSRRC